MEKQDLKKILQNSVKNFKKFFKELVKLPFFKSYIVGSLFLIIIFVVITFPYNVVVKNILIDIKKQNKNTIKELHIENLICSPFSNIIFDSFVLEFKDKKAIRIHDFETYDYGVLDYLISNEITSDFYIGGLKYTSDSFNMTGKLTAKTGIKLSDKNFPVDGDLEFTLSNALLDDIKIKFISLKSAIRVKKLSGEFKFSEKTIDIRKFIFSGNDLKGKISGKIKHNQSMKSARLDLLVTINQNSKLISDYKTILENFLNYDGGNLKLKITGTLNNPQLKKQ